MRLVLGLGDFSLDWFSQMERDGKYGGYSECSFSLQLPGSGTQTIFIKLVVSGNC